jgi:large subunit ribosomal protein L9
MKVILTQTVAGLGDAGTVKEVADGYARNYLLPKKLAIAATRGSLKQAELQAHVYTRRANKVLTEAQQGAAALEGKSITIRARVGSENRLYGSVTPADVATALQSQYNITVDRRRIELDEAIHRTGTYGASADFGQGVSAKFTVEVAPEVAGAHGKATVVGAEPTQAPAPAPAPEAEAEPAAEPAEAPVEEQGEA